jgi:hypothetical protein
MNRSMQFQSRGVARVHENESRSLNTKSWHAMRQAKDSGDVLLEVLTITRHSEVERPKVMDTLVVDCIRDIFGMKGIAR